MVDDVKLWAGLAILASVFVIGAAIIISLPIP
jgi:hypothetical protein